MNANVLGIILIVLAATGAGALWFDTVRKRDK